MHEGIEDATFGKSHVTKVIVFLQLTDYGLISMENTTPIIDW